jgi:hypothetical protein
MAADSVAQARSMIQTALKEVESEIRSLERALAGLGESRRTSSTPAAAPKRRRRRRAKRGQRREEFLAVVKEQPGITVVQAAKKLGVSPPNALYALAKRLVKEGEVTKRGTGYALKGSAGGAKATAAKPKARRRRTKSKGAKSGPRSPGRKAASRARKK